jgi:hypothetical protein
MAQQPEFTISKQADGSESPLTAMQFKVTRDGGWPADTTQMPITFSIVANPGGNDDADPADYTEPDGSADGVIILQVGINGNNGPDGQFDGDDFIFSVPVVNDTGAEPEPATEELTLQLIADTRQQCGGDVAVNCYTVGSPDKATAEISNVVAAATELIIQWR